MDADAVAVRDIQIGRPSTAAACSADGAATVRDFTRIRGSIAPVRWMEITWVQNSSIYIEIRITCYLFCHMILMGWSTLIMILLIIINSHQYMRVVLVEFGLTLYRKVEPPLVEKTKFWPSHLVASQQTNCNLHTYHSYMNSRWNCVVLVMELGRNNLYIGSTEGGLQSSNKEPMFGLVCLHLGHG